MTDPLACSLTEEELQKRREEVLQRVRARVREIRSLEDGYALRFEPDDEALNEVTSMIILERKCCPFLRFKLTLERDNGPAWLEVTGPDEVDALLETELGIGPRKH